MNFIEEFRVMGTFYMINVVEGAAALILPYWIIYFSGIGLSFTQISILMSASFVASIFFEVPTGVVADVYGRKVSVVLSFFLVGLALVAVPFAGGFVALTVLAFFMQAANTLSTGAWDAWLVDYAKREGGRKLVHPAMARAHAFSLAGTLVGFLASGFFVAEFGLAMLWIITGILTFAGGVFALVFGKEHFVPRKVKVTKLLSHTMRESVKGAKYIASHGVVLYVVLGTAFLAFLAIGEIAWQPFLKGMGIPVAYFGPLFAAASLAGMAFSVFSRKFAQAAGSRKAALIISVGAMSVLYFSISFVPTYMFAVLIFLLIASVAGLHYPLRESYFHKFVPSRNRATIGSMKSLIYSIVGIIALFLGGWIADSYGPQAALVACSLLILPAIAMYAMIRVRTKG